MPAHIDLDHVAVAAESAWTLWDRYGGDLGGRLAGGSVTSGFHWSQARFANGMKVEVLQPHDVTSFDFLRRFLDQNGPGPHHLTFKVPDLISVVGRARDSGHQIVGMRTEDPSWQEAFVHPRSAHGIVVQLAQPGEDDGPASDPGSDGADLMPPGRQGGPAELVRIEHLVTSLDAALELFDGVLDGHVAGRADDHVDLTWPGPGRLRLVRPDGWPRRAWLGDRPGRLHHLRFAVDDPSSVRDAVPISGDEWEVRPEDNRGVRLRLVHR